MKVLENGIYREATEAELMLHQPTVEEQTEGLKAQLAATDYKAIKYAEGWLSDEEYTQIKAERQAIRDKINELEREVI